jgi:hypothetical protein
MTLIAGAGTGEAGLIATLPTSVNVQALLTRAGSAIAPDGAIGRNIAAFSDVAAQRDAVWMMLRGFTTGNPADLAATVAAMRYGFQHQAPDGSFVNNLADASASLSADTFFLQSFARVYLGFQTSDYWTPYAAGLQSMLPGLRKSMTWLSQQVPTLLAQDAAAPNRLLFDAIAFEMNGRILNDQRLIGIGDRFINAALAAQRADGSFNEHGGSDTSYQATSMLNLEMLLTYTQDPAMATRLGAALRSATAWEVAHILPSGEVQVAGNSRTGLGQEVGPSGLPKDVNYGEVALSLSYAAKLQGSASVQASAAAVTAYAISYHAPASASASAAYAVASALDVIQIGTGPHTLTGAGGPTVFGFVDRADAHDTITNFHVGRDALDLRAIFAQGVYPGSAASDLLRISQSGKNAILTVDPDGKGPGAAHVLVTLQNVVAAALHPNADYTVR